MRNLGTTVMANVTVLDVGCGGRVCIDGAISNEATGTLTLTNGTVSDNAVGIFNLGTMDVTNTTLSGNALAAIWNGGVMTISQCAVSGAIWFASPYTEAGIATVTNTSVEGECILEGWDKTGEITSNGNNIESPGDTRGFDQPSDQVNVGSP